jgi:hypothetical protein
LQGQGTSEGNLVRVNRSKQQPVGLRRNPILAALALLPVVINNQFCLNENDLPMKS